MLTFLKRLAATVTTPATGKVTLFVESETGKPSYKDDTGTVTSMVGATGQGVPTGGTAGQVLEKIDGTDFNTRWATPSGGGGLTNFTEGVSVSSPNATVPVVSLTATNAATNVDVALKPKGSGGISAHIADGASAGGNKRGARAVDLQLSRSIAAQVASGADTFIVGALNTASASNAIACGTQNAATAQYAVAIGSSNTASGSNATALGSSNTVSGPSASALGTSNNVSGDNSVALGTYASDRGIKYALVFAAGSFASTGDAQSMQMVARRSTTNATATDLTSNGAEAGSTNQLVLPNASAYLVKANVIARENATGDSKSWEVTAHVVRGANAAATALVGTPTVTTLFNAAGAAAWAVAVTADTTNGAIKFTVTGEAAKSIKWVTDIYSCVQVSG